METGDADAQKEEVEAMASIYGEDFRFLAEERVCELHITSSALESATASDSQSTPYLSMRVHLPEDYPSLSIPVAEIDGPWLQTGLRQRIWDGLQQTAEESKGEVLLFKWTDWLKEQDWLWAAGREREESLQISILVPKNISEVDRRETSAESIVEVPARQDIEDLEASLGIVHGEPFTVKKSTFQAHLAPVHSTDAVQTVLSVLLRNRRVAAASHNMMAYRIHIAETNTFCSDCDDDGENAAGGRLLHLLSILDARNVVVVVSRWFGGVLLGPDRFKHINNVARQLMQDCGLIVGRRVTVKK